VTPEYEDFWTQIKKIMNWSMVKELFFWTHYAEETGTVRVIFFF